MFMSIELKYSVHEHRVPSIVFMDIVFKYSVHGHSVQV